MLELFTLDNFLTLMMLVLLQAVLGFDNLLYVAIESKRAPLESQKWVRQIGIGMAIVLRIILLFVVIQAIQLFQSSLFKIDFSGWVEGDFSGHALIVLFGGGFIIWTALKEIMHMLAVHHIEGDDSGGFKSVTSVIISIIFMNLVFSFDSILSAIALTDVFVVMATAILISGILMIVMADSVAEFLKKNRMYEVLGLFILFIVGDLAGVGRRSPCPHQTAWISGRSNVQIHLLFCADCAHSGGCCAGSIPKTPDAKTRTGNQ